MIYILLPAFNEEKSLPKLLSAISSFFSSYHTNYQVIVVDDGSSDRTRLISLEFSKRMPVLTISHEKNRGVAQAMKTGIIHVTENASDDDMMVNMDADNSHTPTLIENLRTELEKGFDIVIASRYTPGAKEVGLSWFRSLCSLSICLFLKLFFPISGVKDYTCGYRMFRVSILKKTVKAFGSHFIDEAGFVSYTEILLKCAMAGARCSEIPLVLRYDLKEGASKMKVFRTIRRYVVLIIHGKRTLRKYYRTPIPSEGIR